MNRGFCQALGMSVATALFAGCGGSQPVDGPGAVPQSRAVAQSAGRGESWMLPDAKSEDLVYVSDNNLSNVYVFSYATGRQVGTLTGFELPAGECADKAGNVWITNQIPAQTVEYAHGGTTPIATLSDDYGSPASCSVDPTTGNLAVANATHTVAVYQNAQGTPTVYSDSSFQRFFFCAFDDNGNLFVDGQTDGIRTNLIAELPHGKSEMTNIRFHRAIEAGNIAWDGQYLAITKGGGDPREATRIARYRVVGARARLVSTIRLQNQHGAAWDAQFWIQGDVIIGPSIKFGQESGSGPLTDVWAYPQGGKPVKALHRHANGGSELWGTTFSLAPR